MRTTPLQRALLLAPAALLLGLVIGLPVARVLQLSLSRTDFDGGIATRFAGLAPLARLWTDGRWLAALRNTAVFTGASVLVETFLGVSVALLLDLRFRGRGLVRAVALVPWALPTAVMALAWAWIFNDSFGVANDLLMRAGLVSAPVAWLARPATAMAALVVADAWKTTPFVAIIVLAGLQAIPRDVFEAARLDGLGPVRTFFRVTLPLLLPAILVAAVFRAVQSWGAFDIVWVLTGGGPGGSTETVSLYAYRNDFRYLDFAYGSTIATQAALLGLALAAVALRLGRRRAGDA